MKQKFLKVIDTLQDCGAVKDGGIIIESCSNKEVAEALIANNAVLLPARIGQEVYAVFTPCGGCEKLSDEERCTECAREAFVDKIKFDWELVPSWGKDVFATEEEAKKRLEELKRNEHTENNKPV